MDDILTYKVEVRHQRHRHLSDRFILVIYPAATVTAYETWVGKNGDLTWTNSLPRVYSALGVGNSDPEPPPPPPNRCENWQSPDSLNKHYHPGASYEMRTEALGSEKTQGHQATYDRSGRLITSGLGAGTADLWTPRTGQYRMHGDEDVKPFIWAAQLDGNPVEGTTILFFDVPVNLTHPLMHRGAKLDQYLGLRPIKASQTLAPNDCPVE